MPPTLPLHRRPMARALLIALLAAACGPAHPSSGEGRGVLMICVDALRADHLSGNGYDRPTTPVLDALADAGVSFTQTWSTAPWNLPATASLLTGCDPYVSRRLLPDGIPSTVATRWSIPPDAPRLARLLLRAGWRTAAFVDHPLIAPLRGFDSGFQTFQGVDGTEEPRGIASVGARFDQWLRGVGPDEDWFAFLHLHDLERAWQDTDPRWTTYFEPRPELGTMPPVGDAEHLFFAVPRPRWPGGLHTLGDYEARYDGALRRIDSLLGRLLQRLAHVGRTRDTTICVVGSHGLGLGEAGLFLDHGTLSEVDLRVPWILRPAVDIGIEGGQRIGALASLLDVAPTLLEITGLSAPASMHGVSFEPLLRGRGGPPRDHTLARAALQPGYAVIDARWTLELTQPWMVEEEILASSWYGHGPPFDEEVRQVLVDRQGAPVDELERAAQALRLCHLGEQWLREVERLRRGLQTVDWLVAAGLEVEPDVQVLGPCAADPAAGEPR